MYTVRIQSADGRLLTTRIAQAEKDAADRYRQQVKSGASSDDAEAYCLDMLESAVRTIAASSVAVSTSPRYDW